MKRLLLVVIVIAAVGFAIGLYMGWFRVASQNADGTSNITLTVDKDKIQQDKDKVVSTVQDLGNQSKDEAAPSQPEPE